MFLDSSLEHRYSDISVTDISAERSVIYKDYTFSRSLNPISNVCYDLKPFRFRGLELKERSLNVHIPEARLGDTKPCSNSSTATSLLVEVSRL